MIPTFKVLWLSVIQLSTRAQIPLELCVVPPGQIIRKQMPSDKISSILEFSTMRPRERFATIREGLSVRPGTTTSIFFSLNSSSLLLGASIWSIRICPPVWHEHFRRPYEFQWSPPQAADTEVQSRLQTTRGCTSFAPYWMSK